MYQTLCNSGSRRWDSGRYGIRAVEVRRPRIVWSLFTSTICPSRTLIWFGTWTNGASAAVTTLSASPTERPSRATMPWNRSAVRGWSRCRMASVSASKALSWRMVSRLMSMGAGLRLDVSNDLASLTPSSDRRQILSPAFRDLAGQWDTAGVPGHRGGTGFSAIRRTSSRKRCRGPQSSRWPQPKMSRIAGRHRAYACGARCLAPPQSCVARQSKQNSTQMNANKPR